MLPQTAPSVAILTGSGATPSAVMPSRSRWRSRAASSGKCRSGVPGRARDHRTGQRPLAHVGERLGVDDVVGVAGPQHLEEVQPAP